MEREWTKEELNVTARAALLHIAQKLQKKRLALGKTVDDVAAASGVSRENVVKIEMGEDADTYKDQVAVAVALDLDPMWPIRESLEGVTDALKAAVAFAETHTVLEAYAYVWNALVSAPSADVAEDLAPLLHQLERKVAFEHLEEYCWERDDNNTWRYVDGTEFCARIRAEREDKE